MLGRFGLAVILLAGIVGVPASADAPYGLSWELMDCQPQNDAASSRDASWDEPVDLSAGSFDGCMPRFLDSDPDDEDVYVFSATTDNLHLLVRSDACDGILYENTGSKSVYSWWYPVELYLLTEEAPEFLGWFEAWECSGEGCWYGFPPAGCGSEAPLSSGSEYALSILMMRPGWTGDSIVDGLIPFNEPVDGDYSFTISMG